MSTVFEGERLLKQLPLEFSNLSGGSTAYTVPAGRYTRIFIQRITLGTGNVSITESDGSSLVQALTDVSTLAGMTEIILYAGQKIINTSINTSNFFANALEFEAKNS